MSGLRWALLLFGLVVLAGIYLYSRYKPKLDKTWAARRERREPSLTHGHAGDASAAAEEQTPQIAEPTPQKLVTIRLMSRDTRGFEGERLILMLRQVHMRHGRFGIFHFHDSADPNEVIFSIASLTEPGSFDLTNLKTTRFPGISLFMQLPGPIDGVEAFDLMMAKARELAQALDGLLSDDQGSSLSVQRERFLREEVIQFQHGQLTA